MSLSKVCPDDCHYEPKTDEILFKCDGCKMNGFGSRFTCNRCRCDLHRECMNPKSHINPEYLGSSTLTFLEIPFKRLNKRSKTHEYSKCCYACGKEICGFSYHCKACKLNLHPCCANLEKQLPIDGTVFNLVSKASSECKRCHKREISNGNKKVPGWWYVSTCGKNNFHVYCMTEKVHEEKDQLTKTKRNGGSEGTKFETNILMIVVLVLKIVYGVSVLKIVIWLFICRLIWAFIGRRHDCHSHYKPKTDGKHFTCVGCKMTGFGPRHTCDLCGHELHEECRDHKPHINHEFFECSTLTFLEKPITKFSESNKRNEYSRYCGACGKKIRGFSYHCEADNLDLHPCCANLEKKLRIDRTVIFNLVSNKVSSKCLWCNKREISDGDRDVPGWSYVSTCRKYNFHVYCMTDMVHDARIKHGNSALEKVDLKQLTKTKKNGGSRVTMKTIELFLQIIGSVLFGDPTLLIANGIAHAWEAINE